MEARLTKVWEEYKNQETRIKEGFINCNSDINNVKSNLAHRLHQEENAREHQGTNLRDAIDYVNKAVDHKCSELVSHLENERRTRAQDLAPLSSQLVDLGQRTEDVNQDLANFKMHVMQDCVTELKFGDGVADLSSKIAVEATRRQGESEKFDVAFAQMNEHIARVAESMREKCGDLEKGNLQAKQELISRDEDLMNHLNVDRISIQKLETNLGQE